MKKEKQKEFKYTQKDVDMLALALKKAIAKVGVRYIDWLWLK